MPDVLAIDVGGTTIKAARVDEAGAVSAERSLPTPVAQGPSAVLDAVRAIAQEAAAPGVVAAGVVAPGVVDANAGVARYAANLGWRDVPLRELIAADLGVPVALDHDVRAAGRAEVAFGGLRGVRDGLLVVIGTGIAAVVVTGGQVACGARGLAGEVGHVPVYPDGDSCACGHCGCTEVYASAAGIARRYIGRTGVARSAREIAAALDGDAAAAAVWTDAAEALGLALATCVLVLDPEVIVLGGGLAAAGEVLRRPVAAALAQRLAWRPAPPVEISPLGGRAGLLGAALLARSRLSAHGRAANEQASGS